LFFEPFSQSDLSHPFHVFYGYPMVFMTVGGKSLQFETGKLTTFKAVAMSFLFSARRKLAVWAPVLIKGAPAAFAFIFREQIALGAVDATD